MGYFVKGRYIDTHTYRVTFISTILTTFTDEPTQNDIIYNAWEQFDIDNVSIHSIEEL